MPDNQPASSLSHWLNKSKLAEWFSVSEKGTFALFVLLASVVWMLGALSKEYTLEIPVAINYENLPTDMVATTPLVDELFVTVKGEGRSLMRKNRDARKNGVQLDLSKSASNSRIAVTSLIPQIAEQFSGLVISGIQPDSLVFKFVESQTKKVPVVAKHDLTFASQFDLQSIKLTPDSVTISGPKTTVDEIDNWTTENITYENISDTQTGEINLKESEVMGFEVAPIKSSYEIKVNEFTEKVVLVPIASVGLPENKKVILYPNQAQLTFQLTVDNYSIIDESFFEVEAEFNGKIDAKENQVPIKVVTQPLGAKNVRIEPKLVEFIIYK